ncbi:MAG: Gfo/Idh/MocA family protein [Sphaerochaeta sp.]|jgi:predicted dehydrogenase
MKKVRIGIIGFGKMGTQHAKALMQGKVPNAELSSIADIDGERIKVAKELFGERVACFNSATELIQSRLCDAIIPTVPHYYHPCYAIEAFEAGLHVLCEKPAGVYATQVEAMNAAASKSGKVFGMMFNQRTNPLYIRARQMVQAGELGRLIHAHWIITSWFRSQSYYDKSPWRATWAGEGGGVLLNQNPHNLDLWQWICGFPTKVKATMSFGKHRAIETEDDVFALFEFPNGMTGVYVTTIADSPGTNRLEISGTRGKLVIENNRLTFHALDQDSDEFNAQFDGEIGQPKCQVVDIPVEGNYSSHCGIIENFCSAILDGTPLLAPGEEGIASLLISNAMHLSAWTNEDWVVIGENREVFDTMLAKKCGGTLPV